MTPSKRARAPTEERMRDLLFESVGVDFPEPPEVLYHYTTHIGLAGILSSKRLWASNLLFMNDASELEDGMKFFGRAIADAQQRGLLDEAWEPFGEWYLNGPGFNISFGIFGVCFSELGDDLSQWRAYAPGGGYALGFDGKELQRMHTRGIATLDQVIYDDQRKKKIADGTVAAAIRVWREIMASPERGRARRIKIFRAVLEHAVRHSVCIMKNSSFAAEREWRLFVANADLEDDSQVQYRAGSSYVIPYTEIPIGIRGRKILRRAVAGPSAHQDLATSGMIGCVVDNGFKDVATDESRVPYRS